MFVRLALKEDFDAIAEMARMNVADTRPDMVFNEERCRATLQSYIDHASPTFFVVEEHRKVIAFLTCDFYEYRAADGLFTTQEVIFVLPERRGSRAAAILMKQLIVWSEQLGAREIVGGNDNEFNSERTARFLGHFGFKRVGYSMRRALANGR